MIPVSTTAELVARELSLPLGGVTRTLELMEGGATVPFIARYRKEVTGGLDDGEIQRIHDHAAKVEVRESRRASILASLTEQKALTPALEKSVRAAATLAELEDLYLPYKPKRRTRAQTARERGLGPLAELLLDQAPSAPAREALGGKFVNPARDVPDLEAAFQGARDIVAETIAERAEVRAQVRRLFETQGELTVEVARGKSEAPELAKYRDHLGRREKAALAPSHRLLAAERGETEGLLRVRVEVERQGTVGAVRPLVTRRGAAPVLAREVELALEDAVDRLLEPSLESEFRRKLKDRADEEAIRVFAQNLESLLLASPLGSLPVLAIDPGLRTGCKLAALDAEGEVKALGTIFPHTGREAEAGAALAAMVKAHRPGAIAIGNGTAGRETEAFVRKLLAAGALPKELKVVMVSEAGASVYSASELAREELPALDVTLRGAVSIGRRLQDPLSELVKIDPKSIGVGQYQHDVDQTALAGSLDRVVEAAVNRVGVDLNTASPTLLRYVAGLGPALAKAIVAFRAENGPFKTRAAVKKVPRLGGKAFEQCAGFLRVRGGSEPLDQSAVHPERYPVVAKMAEELKVPRGALVGNAELAAKIPLQRYVDEQAGIGLPTLQDIVEELKKPGRDPRAEFQEVGFDAQVTELSHVKEGMVLNGVVTNVAAFGAFVDIGVHQDGLVHVSELANRFIKDPAEVVKVGDRVRVKVLSVDLPRKRMGLSIKALQPGAATAPQSSAPAPRKPEPFNAPRRR
ncbi:MAG: RNA-binding transcriptional accessory protein [Myxococcota bacterium]|nr:RNA-binding transcriptional accessory protein [Myxococcota bacterium]